jgi:hypothetical protein
MHLIVIHSPTMTAAAARTKRTTKEPDSEAPAAKPLNALWIDPARLPTKLAQTGKKPELAPLEPWSSLKRGSPTVTDNRILEYADLVLGIEHQRRAVDKKK